MSKLIAYRIHATEQRIVAGRSRRRWMDETHYRYAYRCLPLTIANAMGWEITLPAGLTAEWSGGSNLSDVTLREQRSRLRGRSVGLFAFRPRHFDFPRKLFVPDRAGDCAMGAGSAKPTEGWHRAT